MTIQKAESKDLKMICALYEQFYAYYAKQQPKYYQKAKASEAFYAKLLKSDKDAIFYASDDSGKPIGFSHVTEKQTPPIEFYVQHRFAVLLENFVVADLRGSGIGTQLLNQAKEWTKQRELEYLELRVLHLNDFARHFYEQEDFEVTAHTMRCIME